jgi:hypothetical protein
MDEDLKKILMGTLKEIFLWVLCIVGAGILGMFATTDGERFSVLCFLILYSSVKPRPQT